MGANWKIFNYLAESWIIGLNVSRNECIGEGASQIRHTWYMTQNRKSPTHLYWKEEEQNKSCVQTWNNFNGSSCPFVVKQKGKDKFHASSKTFESFFYNDAFNV